jgi:hypothetical protein
MDKPTSSVADDQEVKDPVETQDQTTDQTVTDANTDSTQSSGVESEGANEPKTLEEVIRTAAERNKPKQETAQPAEDGKETKPEAEAETDAKAESEAKDDKVPFHNHPRWKELLQERDEYRGRAERFDAITTYMQNNALSSEDVADGFEVMGLMKKNPAEALKRLEEYTSNLRQVLGLVLPSDLQAKVDEGAVDEEVAKELARTRNAEALARAQLQERESLEQQRVQQEAHQRVAFEMATAVDGLVNQIKGQDPDYPVKEAFIVDRVKVLRMERPPRTKEDAVALVQEAYADATERLKALSPRRQPVKTATSAASTSTAAKPEPKSLREAIELSLRA